MNEMQGINLITVAQNLATANTPEGLQEAMKQLHLSCLTQPVAVVREISRHLEEISKVQLVDRVRDTVKNGKYSKDAAVALEDVENLTAPVLAAPILSEKARQLALHVECLISLRSYCSQRVQMLEAIQHLPGEEAEALTGMLTDRLTVLLILEVLVEKAAGDKALNRQIDLWQMLYIARTEGQVELAPYFLALDEGDTIQCLLPCCIPYEASAKTYYRCAGILKALVHQKEIREYEALVHSLHGKVEQKVIYRVSCGRDDEDTMALEELYVLLRVALHNAGPVVWEYPRFEKIKKNLEEN